MTNEKDKKVCIYQDPLTGKKQEYYLEIKYVIEKGGKKISFDSMKEMVNFIRNQ